MKEMIITVMVYACAYVIGKLISDSFLCGWISGMIALTINLGIKTFLKDEIRPNSVE